MSAKNRYPTELPENVYERDLEEIARTFRHQMKRCLCGHLKVKGFVCEYCGESRGQSWGQTPIED